jgi:hypothetical protein
LTCGFARYSSTWKFDEIPLFSQLAFAVAGLLKDPSSLSEEEAGQIGKGFHKTLLILPLNRKAL